MNSGALRRSAGVFLWGIGGRIKGNGGPYNAAERYAGARVVFCGELEGELKEMVNRITQRSVTPECGVFCGELKGGLKELVDRITQRSVTPEREKRLRCGENLILRRTGGP